VRGFFRAAHGTAYSFTPAAPVPLPERSYAHRRQVELVDQLYPTVPMRRDPEG